MSVFEDSTTNGWLRQPGPINLRHSEQRDTTRKELRAATGILGVALVMLVIVALVLVVGWWLR